MRSGSCTLGCIDHFWLITCANTDFFVRVYVEEALLQLRRRVRGKRPKQKAGPPKEGLQKSLLVIADEVKQSKPFVNQRPMDRHAPPRRERLAAKDRSSR
jgi:hypothetical protein